jgi:phosphohistidine phosphatase
MKTLHILRHAKTERLQPGQQDFHRKLTQRGLNQMKDLLVNQKNSLSLAQRVLVSSSRRTRMTLEQIEHLYVPESIVFLNELYLASKNTITRIIEKKDDSIDHILVIGHNDGLSDFVSYLTDVSHDLPTSGYVVLELEIDSWSHISKGIAVVKTKFYSSAK